VGHVRLRLPEGVTFSGIVQGRRADERARQVLAAERLIASLE